MIIKKINISLLLILILFFILLKNINFFKNFYTIIYETHDKRQQSANDFCELFGSGYVFYIKEKFKLKKSPTILNSAVSQDWIFPDKSKTIDQNKFIIINNNKDLKLKLSEFKILDNFNNRCLFLVKKWVNFLIYLVLQYFSQFYFLCLFLVEVKLK